MVGASVAVTEDATGVVVGTGVTNALGVAVVDGKWGPGFFTVTVTPPASTGLAARTAALRVTKGGKTEVRVRRGAGHAGTGENRGMGAIGCGVLPACVTRVCL